MQHAQNVYVLMRLEGQQINQQIFLNPLDITCLVIIYHLVMKNRYILTLNFDYFVIS